MIKSSNQLKAKVRNLSGGDDKVAKALIRIFFMERFMERVSLSPYRDQFILKGGMLVSSLIGINLRATMDIDTTVKALPLTEADIARIINEITQIPLEDNISFKITKIETIMEEFDYPGVRVHLEAYLERLKQAIKIDISTDDVITPSAIEYVYQLNLEDRSIKLNTYNVETMLAEKAQTILNRGIANTRMRDFYDIYELSQMADYSDDIVKNAFVETCKKRETVFTDERILVGLEQICNSDFLALQWRMFQEKNYYVGDIDFDSIAEIVTVCIKKIAGLS